MKNNNVIIILTAILFSFQQTELEFSYDPVINKFVIENHAELYQINVTELATYDLLLQKAVFNSWDAQRKRNAWIEKLRAVLPNETFSTTEQTHIQKLIDHLQPGYFLDERIQQESKTRAQFANEWVRYTYYELGWTELFVAFMIYRLNSRESKLDNELSMLKSISTTVTTYSESGSCNCNISADFCGGVDCQSSGCTQTSGCGWYGL